MGGVEEHNSTEHINNAFARCVIIFAFTGVSFKARTPFS